MFWLLAVNSRLSSLVCVSKTKPSLSKLLLVVVCLFRVLSNDLVLTESMFLLCEMWRKRRQMTPSHMLPSLLLGMIETTATCWKWPAVQAIKCKRSCV